MSYLYYSGLSNKYVYSFLGKNMAGYWLIDWKKIKIANVFKICSILWIFSEFSALCNYFILCFFRISCPAIISYILVGTKFYFQKIESLWTKLIFTTLFLPLSLFNLNATYLKLLQKWYKYSWNLNCPSYRPQFVIWRTLRATLFLFAATFAPSKSQMHEYDIDILSRWGCRHQHHETVHKYLQRVFTFMLFLASFGVSEIFLTR